MKKNLDFPSAGPGRINDSEVQSLNGVKNKLRELAKFRSKQFDLNLDNLRVISVTYTKVLVFLTCRIIEGSPVRGVRT